MRPESIELIARAVIRVDGRVLLACDRGTDRYFLPGGHVEPGEPAEAALVRELAEELGTPATVTRFRCAAEHRYTDDAGRPHHELNLIFEVSCARLAGDADPVSREPHLRFAWVPVSDLGGTVILPGTVRAVLINPVSPVWVSGSG